MRVLGKSQMEDYNHTPDGQSCEQQGDLLSVVVPCFNEEGSIPHLYEKLNDVLRGIGCGYEIVLVDDGSTDGTYPLMETLAQEDEHLKLISFSRNFGKESALYAGLSNAIGSYVAVLDADLQDPPELLAEMYFILREGRYDCVAAYRATRKGEPVLRSLFANAFYRINNRLADTRIVNGARDFRMMNRSMVNAVLSMTEANRFSKGLFSWVGFDTCWLSYENVERVEGKSKWNFFRLFRYAVEGIVNFSQAPLMIASAFGLILTIVAFVFLVLIVVRRILFGDPVDGWASLISVIIFLGGCQLFSIGILGAYLGKAYVETKRRPHYIIKRTNIHGAKKIN